MNAGAWRVATMAALLVVGTAPQARAADARKDAREAAIPLPPVPPLSIDLGLPPYQVKLDRLAELMGTLSFLRDLCGSGDGPVWRARMDALLNAEGTTPARRDRLAGSYNRGYAGYRLTYHGCTTAARTVIARALSDGARLASDVSAQFNQQP